MRASLRLTSTLMLCLAGGSCAPGPSDSTSAPDASASVAQTLASTDAQYDAQLAAPACASYGALCDSNTLLTGRGTVGPESNAPNTLGGSCADGNDGTF